MEKKITVLAIAGLLALFAGPAIADYVSHSGYYSYQGTLGGSSGYVVGNGMSGPSNVQWGLYRLQGGVYNSTTNKYVASGPSYAVACIDLVQNASSSWLWYDDVDLTDAPIGSGNQTMNQVEAMRLRELWTEHYAQTGSSVGKAAFQLAVWELVYQHGVESPGDYTIRTGWTHGVGGFQATAPTTGTSVQKQAADLAETWLKSLNGLNDVKTSNWYGTDQFLNVRALVNGGVQDWAFYSPDMGIIPAPAAVVLGVVGLGLVGWVRRRFG